MGCVHSSHGKKTSQDTPSVSPSKTRQTVRESGAFHREIPPDFHNVPLSRDNSGSPTLGTAASTCGCETEASRPQLSPSPILVGESSAQEDSVLNASSSSSKLGPPRKKHRYSMSSSTYFQQLRSLSMRAHVPMVSYPSTSTPSSQVSMKNLDETLRSLHSIVAANAEKLSMMELYFTARASPSPRPNHQEDLTKPSTGSYSAVFNERSPATPPRDSTCEVAYYNS